MMRLQSLLRSVGTRHGMVMGIAMVLAGGLDYAVNVIAGRWLEPVQYGIFISVMAILQVMLLLAIAIRMVVAFYTVELAAREDSAGQVGTFVRRAWRWAWRWGLAGTLVMALSGPLLAHWLRLANPWPVWAASLMVLMLFLRETGYGALQGTLAFAGLGLVQVVQALLRIVFSAGLISLGGHAAGAILALPLSCAAGLWLALWWLRPVFRSPDTVGECSVSWRYSANTLMGLAAFGLLTNLDAIFVKRFFSPEVAGNYGPVVTLAKISLFLPWAIGIVLFPKVARRQATGRDPRPILWMALAAALAPGLGLTILYFAFPRVLVSAVFANAYGDPGVVLGMASLAATLYAGLNIWLNYALSLGRPTFIYAMLALVVFQAGSMLAFGRERLVNVTLVMVATGLIGNLSGLVATWSAAPAAARKPVQAKAAAAETAS
jgi:O-antigen/teichoic acid export membrane protein